MKHTLSFLLFSLVFQSFGFASAGPAEVDKLTTTCEFNQSPTKRLEAQIYSLSSKEEFSGAHVVINSVSSRGKVLRVLARYELTYIDPKKPSLFLSFENKERKEFLELFADDVGGLSTLTLGSKSYSLTCQLQKQ